MIVSAEIVALIAAAVAVFAAVLAVRATALVARTALAHHDAQVHHNRLDVRVTEGHCRRDLATDSRDYAFIVSVTNPSATERRFSTPTLRVTYRTRANFLGAVDLKSPEPLVATAGQTSNATLRFTTSNVIPRHCRVDAYTLVLTDARGERELVDASLPAVLDADTDGTGSSTWGLD
jgi:hypothetical protein